MEKTITKRKWFWAWQDDKEEAWLEAMSAKGLHLVSTGAFGVYVFRQGEPQDYHYRLDFITAVDQEQRENYIQLFADSGWTHLGELGGWQYFRKAAGEEINPEIFTDAESKVKKYQRLLGFLVIFVPVYFSPIYLQRLLSPASGWWVDALMIFFTLFTLFFSFAIVRILMRISELKKTIRQ